MIRAQDGLHFRIDYNETYICQPTSSTSVLYEKYTSQSCVDPSDINQEAKFAKVYSILGAFAHLVFEILVRSIAIR